MTRLVCCDPRQMARPSRAWCVRRLNRRLALVLVPALAIAALGCREDAEPPTAAEPEPSLHVTPAHALSFRQVTAGEDHACGVTTGNVAYCWGSNGSGALGIGTNTGPGTCFGLPCSTRPVRVVGGLAFRQLSAEGRFHTCGVTRANAVYCWGTNASGQLGIGTGNDSPRPVRVVGGLAFFQVSAGTLHTCGVTTNGVAYCWGHNQAGELGDGTTTQRLRPVRVARGLAFRQVSAGEQFTCGVTTDDVAYCWGSNSAGQLGRGTSTGPELCFDVAPCSTRPIRVVGGLAFGGVSGGASHTCGVTKSEVDYCWGSNGSGELGIGSKTGPETCFGLPCSTRPVRVAGGLAFRGGQAGATYSCGVTTEDVAYCWGTNFTGQLGDGTTQERLRPRPVAGAT